MEPITILLIVLAILAAMLLIETPVAWALALAGVIGIAMSGRAAAAWSALGALPYSDTANYTIAVIPLYILMGMFAFYARIPEDIYTVAARALGRLPGGMGAATTLACAAFAAVNGSSVATAATFAKLSAGEMIKRGYKPGYATAIVASAGTLGMIIPPSIVLVMYGVITGESIGRMLVAGIIPGIIIALVFTAHTLTFGRRNIVAPVEKKELVTAGVGSALNGGITGHSGSSAGRPVTATATIRTPLDGHHRSPISGLLGGALLFAIVVLGIYGGFMTVTESAAVGVVAALVMVIFTRRREGFRGIFRALADSVTTSASTTSMAIATLFGASVFGYYVVSSGLPAQFSRWVQELPVPSWVAVAIFLLTLIPLGMILESIPMMLIFLPLAYPVVESLGYDGIWFGILVVIMIELGMICPPIGLNVFVASNAVGVKSHETYKYSMVYVYLLLGVVALLFVFPDIITFLPSLVE